MLDSGMPGPAVCVSSGLLQEMALCQPSSPCATTTRGCSLWHLLQHKVLHATDGRCVLRGVQMLQTGDSLYSTRYVWPAEQDRMLSLHTKRPDLVQPMVMQYTPMLAQEAFLSPRHRDDHFLVWHACAFPAMKRIQARQALEFLQRGAAHVTLQRVYERLNATSLVKIDCSLRRFGWTKATVAPDALALGLEGLLGKDRHGDCTDDTHFSNGHGMGCVDYQKQGYCKDGSVTPGHDWTMGKRYHYPECACCICGKSVG